MYKVFVGDIPIILSTDQNIGENYYSAPIKEANIKQIVKKIKKGALQKVHLYHAEDSKLLTHFKKQLQPILAAGGKVNNDNGEILFIFRKGLWDLPKGRMEKNESIEATAIREVEEETGVKKLRLSKPLPTTYHVMERNGKFRLKITYWFEMQTSYSEALIPQTEEGITLAEWKDFEESRKALQ